MAEESTKWRVTVTWPRPRLDRTRNLLLRDYLGRPDMLRKALWDVYPVDMESFEVGPRTARLVVTTTGETTRPYPSGGGPRFYSSAQAAVDVAVKAACHAALLTRLVSDWQGLPEPVRFEVRSAA